ncbi:hypothetical protein KJ708_04555 [bacterium]|nr:hypothetical protein [bacterium]MBU1918930.1 hypothetical protein [bacterium]
MKEFLFVTKNELIEKNVASACTAHDFTFLVEHDFDRVLSLIESEKIKYIFIDIDDESLRGLQLLEWIQTRFRGSHIGVFSQKSYKPDYVKALRLGATERLPYDAVMDEDRLRFLLSDFSRTYALEQQLLCYTSPRKQDPLYWVGADPSIRFLIEKIKILSQTYQPVFIKGQKGVGKKHLATIMGAENTLRSLVVVDAETIPDYEQKVFLKDQLDALEGSIDCTVFLYEVTQLHPELQEAIAEYLKDGVLSLDGYVYKKPLQLVTTSTHNLFHAAEQGFIREDLSFILSRCQLTVPPLKKRISDLPLLVQYFLDHHKESSEQVYFSQDSITAMSHYAWPGNVKELFEALKQILEENPLGMITSRALPHRILQKSFYTTSSMEEGLTDVNYNEAKKRVVNQFNHDYIKELLEKADDNLTVAAERAGMDRSNFKKIIKKYGVK